jgi:hypothetical protein
MMALNSPKANWTIRGTQEPVRKNMVISLYFVTAPDAAPGNEVAMLLFYNGLVRSISRC